MAYSVKTMILAGALAFSGVAHVQASSLDPSAESPISTFNPAQYLQQQNMMQMLMGQGVAGNLALMNGFNAASFANMNIGQMLQGAVMNAAMSTLTSKLSELGPLGSILGAGVVGGISGGLTGNSTSMFGSLGTTGLTSNLLGNTLNNSFGGLVNGVVNGVVTAAVNQGVTAVLGGIQSSGSSSSSSSDSSTATATATNSVVLSTTASVDTSSANYTVGTGDGLSCTAPDSGYLTDSGYDSNYWAGYKAALASCTSVTI